MGVANNEDAGIWCGMSEEDGLEPGDGHTGRFDLDEHAPSVVEHRQSVALRLRAW